MDNFDQNQQVRHHDGVKILSIILLVIVSIALGYFIGQKQQLLKSSQPTDSGLSNENNNSMNQPLGLGNSTQNNPQPAVNTQNSPNLVARSDWGISLEKPSGWNIITTTDNQITIKQDLPDGAGDVMTVDYVTGDSITDTDAKFGNITFFYDSTRQTWMKSYLDEQSNTQLITEVATPEMIVDGLSVFKGTGRWLTYVIPLSHTNFIKINITGSGNLNPLNNLLSTIKTI